jgi:hypothetical protein
MPRHKKADMMSISTEGKPTEATGVPQPMPTRHSIMEGIVKGVPRGTYTSLPDGMITGLKDHASGKMMKVAPSATKIPTQEFGSVNYAVSAYGRK